MEKFIADIVKGASDSFSKGKRVSNESLFVQRDGGIETKIANLAALGAGVGGLLVPGIGAPIGAALGADDGQGLAAAGGTILGALGGGMGGRVLGSLVGGPMGAAMGTGLGAGAGALYGAHRGGQKSAADRFGIKEAFLGPLLGSIAAPAAARAGLGALAGKAGTGAIGSMASKVLPHVGSGMGGMAFDAATSMAGGALGNKLERPMGPMG